jgi:serine protease Do
MFDYQPFPPYPFRQPSPQPPANRWPLAAVLITGMVLCAILGGVYLVLKQVEQRRKAEDQATADGAYLKRQAELKAEAEAAAHNLDTLDRRVKLVSLGFREVARTVAPVLVNVTNEVKGTPPIDRRKRFFYDFETETYWIEQSEGSGVIVKPGYVLTNHHVVKGAERLRVTFASGRWLAVEAGAIKEDPLTDLAVLRLPADPGPAFEPDYAVSAQFADSDKDVQVGDWVLAAGSPFGLKQTVTAGIVSAKGRVELGILDQVELIQTDAPINPGNSGGPLVDLHGRVVGINVAIASDNGRSQGVGFAIPSSTAQEIFKLLVEHGEVVRGYVGILMQEVPQGLEKKVGVAETGGVFVTDVVRDSPGGRADLRRGDVIVRYNGEPVGTVNPMNNLRMRIARTPPETTVPVEVQRAGKRLTLEVTIAKRPPLR